MLPLSKVEYSREFKSTVYVGVNELVEMDAEGTAKMFASLTENIS